MLKCQIISNQVMIDKQLVQNNNIIKILAINIWWEMEDSKEFNKLNHKWNIKAFKQIEMNRVYKVSKIRFIDHSLNNYYLLQIKFLIILRIRGITYKFELNNHLKLIIHHKNLLLNKVNILETVCMHIIDFIKIKKKF